jgi:hypothetical protein
VHEANVNRIPIVLAAFSLLIFQSGCSRQDKDEAKRKLREASQELKRETKQAGQELKHDAHEASKEIKKETEKLKHDGDSK